MKSKRAAKKQSSSPRGFTFTISIVILAITLIAMALFSQEWRKSQRVSFTELMPSEAARIEERVSSDMGAMLGADASVSKTSTDVTVDISSKMPFKKEGAPIAEMGDYAASLPSSLKNTGAEAVLSANEITGSTATVMKISDTGQLVYSNDGANDILTYYHPSGWQPSQISADIVCGKAASTVGAFSVTNPPITEDGNSLTYLLHYSDVQTSQRRDALALANGSSATLTVSYPDGTKLVFSSDIAGLPFNSNTRLSYTKSPGGALVLPFDENVSEGYVRDYSSSSHFFQAGAAAPIWSQNCKSGGCYSFLGANYMGGNLQLTESALFLPAGGERVSNGGFESVSGMPDDEEPDSWLNWAISESEGVSFYSTSDSFSGYAVMVTNSAASQAGGNLHQTLTSLAENSPYALELRAKGASSGYAISTLSGGITKYLQADGTTWNTTSHEFLAAGYEQSSYTYMVREFVLPLGSNSATIYLYSPAKDEIAYYDGISVWQPGGFNGGFEYYYADVGWTPNSETQ